MLRSFRVPQSRIHPNIIDRALSVLAWGCSSNGQCGSDASPVLTSPSPIRHLDDLKVRRLAAGSLQSAAVLENGTVLAWGCGKHGKLGQAVLQDRVSAPSRVANGGSSWGARVQVEALADKARIADVAVGCQHTLFLEEGGLVWSCGENKEGQCGLGAPLATRGRRKRMKLAATAQAHSQLAAEVAYLHSQVVGAGGAAAASAVPPSLFRGSAAMALDAGALSLPYLKSFVDHAERMREVESVRQLLAPAGRTPSASLLPWSAALLADAGPGAPAEQLPAAIGTSYSEASAVQTARGPVDVVAPTRLGHGGQPLLDDLMQDAGPQPEAVVSVAASRYFSALATAQGEVWTFGSGFNGELGRGQVGRASAPQRVGVPLAATIAELGGATKVVAGGTFCAALTTSGRVVVWGRLSGKLAGASAQGPATGHQVLQHLPWIRDLAAGTQALVATDGERAWALGSLHYPDTMQPLDYGWERPQQVLECSSSGIASVAAGGSSAAAVTGDGQLYMWGRVLERARADYLCGSRPGCRGAERQRLRDAVAGADWSWPGFGGRIPRLVKGLAAPVAQIALGSMHALVLLA